ncbi:MAG TPA: hypothetical protein VFO86_08860, partial [Terriglobia bacterium]|nr:hypothetical protein [Terriglobia bacterium]
MGQECDKVVIRDSWFVDRLISQIPNHESRITFFVLLLITFSTLSCNRGITPGVLRFSHFWSEPGQRAVMDSVIDEFRKENPDIPVEV